MSASVQILYLENDPQDVELLRQLLDEERLHCQITVAADRARYEQALRQSQFDLVISDDAIPEYDGLHALLAAQARQPHAPFILLSRTTGGDLAIDCLKRGASDFVNKQRLPRLAPAIRRALREGSEREKRRRDEATQRESEQRYRAELEKREEYFHALTELSSDVIAVADPEGRARYVSSSVARLLGYEPAELIGACILDLAHPEDRTLAQESLAKLVVTDRKIAETEVRVRDKAGAWHDVEILGRNLLRDPNVEGIILNIRDVTERKREQARIQEQAALLDRAQDAIMVADLESKVLFWNRSAERLYGWTAPEAVGQTANTLLFPPHSPEPVAAVKSLISRGEWSGELQQVTRDKHEIVVASRWSLVRDKAGRPESILIINTDISERRKLEAQFLRAQRMESLGALAGGIAHDLNNVLAPIIMVADLLRETVTDPERQDWLNTLQKSAQHGAELVKQILSFARGADDQTVHIQVRHLIAEHVKMLEETLPRSIQMKTRSERDLWVVMGDPTKLTQVLMNLSVNARDAMPQGGTLQILASNLYVDKLFTSNHPDLKPGPHVRISVSDTGTGIPEAIRSRIFEPFFTTKDITKGTGLGLATSLGIVKRHNGALTVYSELGKGTQFNIYLPALLTDKIQQTELTKKPPARGRGECVLVVDDDGPVRTVTEATLKTQGYEVITAKNGAEALHVFRENPDRIQLVLTDMMMPIMDGPTLIRTLRQEKPELLLVAFSGMIGTAEGAELVSSGMVVFLPKPFTAEQLLTTIRDAFAQKRVDAPT